MGGDSTLIKAALSDDQSLAAVAISSSEQQQQQRRVIQVYQVENGLLQTTLTAKSKSQSFDKILFCGKDHVIALSKCSSSSSSNSAAVNSSTGQVFIWDLSRGGVVAHSLADEASRKQYLDAASTGNHLYLLVAVSGSTSGSSRKSSGVGGDDSDNEGGSKANKLQVHQYDPSTGRLTRKIKCGKCGDLDAELGLAVQEEKGGKVQLILRNSSNSHHEAFRVLDAETGSKLGKHKYRDGKKQAKKEGTGGSGILIAGSIVAIPRISSVAIYNTKTSKWLKPIPAKSSDPQVQLWKTMEGEDNASLLLVDQELYKCESNGVESISKIQSDYSLALLPRSTYQVAAVLHNPKAAKNSIQIQLVDWGKEDLTQHSDALGLFQPEVTIQWESSDENNASSDKDRSSKKRNAESMTLLGAGQAGGESTSVSERKGQKKPKQDLDDEAEDMDVDVDNDNSNKNDQNMSIADRLKKLSEAMDNKAGDEESVEEGKRDATKGKRDRSNSFVPKRATTESLTQLLSQALRGGDDQLLELALAVKDKAVLQETFKGLDNYSIEILLTKLTTRLAGKPQRAEDLAFWLSHVLQSGRVRRMSQLQPLKNLLQDRIEAFPHLLRLEGRLSMIRSEGKGGPLGKKQMKLAK